MSKQAEISYLANTGEAGRWHSLYKPFSDPSCGTSLATIGTIMQLLPPAPARLLDFGCGGGWTSVFYALHGFRVTGQDIAPDMIALAMDNRARNGLSAEQLDLLCSDFENLDLQEQYDAAIFFDCLHHADDEELAIRSAYNALKPGGILITHEPGEGHSINPHTIAVTEQYGVNERDMPPSLIVKCGLAAGFSHFRVLPMHAELFNVFYADDLYRGRRKLKWKYRLVRRVLRMLFRPNMAAGSIVVLTK